MSMSPTPEFLPSPGVPQQEFWNSYHFWNSYLSTGRGAKELFESIDVDKSGTIPASAFVLFLDFVNREGVRVEEFVKLEEQGTAGDELSLQEFLTWLVAATSIDEHKEAEVQVRYENHASTGRRRSTIIKKKVEYAWNETTMSQSLRRMQYAVRGEVVMRAESLRAEGREIIFTNVGNPHAVKQKPITYYRQVLALCDLPAECGVDHPSVEQMFPKDVIAKAKEYKAAIGGGGTGSYSHSQGIKGFRDHVANFIEERDGHPAFAGDIFLTNGASTGIQNVLLSLMSGNNDAVMIPIPQYPIYSALIALMGGRQVGYALDESAGWAVTKSELEKSLADAKAKGFTVKALALINPGNPTGQVLDREPLEAICRFCSENGIVLLADEVYQRNIYAPNKKFISAKKLACETEGCEDLQLVSFHSTSKGLIGECGRRGGYMELHHIDPYVQAQLYKLVSSGLCSGIAGQVMMSLMVNPPKPGDESYDQFAAEEKAIFDSLVRRSKSLVAGLNKIDGVTCETAEGATYAFPSIIIPEGAIAEAKERNQTPDTLYAISLLEETGICVVPASGFGQKKGRVGFRTTFLPPEDELDRAIDGFGSHHKNFCDRYA
eukprot:CAMPEP_0201911334 /NCGR_PEP_ID=MMETSP0903-20130614/2312_1 /ASSEMBLY_ACC=CAM_ASM_000552 /TAXON_ID=420261 /ORGANISM="Thalassiosira antarctica, Strain CCMP982" /LENGTH=604 /DNA_ID=CAMNT_0048446035 /DNA_START=35 /DNA_END=1849 /DNA_ORIENTATION=-